MDRNLHFEELKGYPLVFGLAFLFDPRAEDLSADVIQDINHNGRLRAPVTPNMKLRDNYHNRDLPSIVKSIPTSYVLAVLDPPLNSLLKVFFLTRISR